MYVIRHHDKSQQRVKSVSMKEKRIHDQSSDPFIDKPVDRRIVPAEQIVVQRQDLFALADRSVMSRLRRSCRQLFQASSLLGNAIHCLAGQ